MGGSEETFGLLLDWKSSTPHSTYNIYPPDILFTSQIKLDVDLFILACLKHSSKAFILSENEVPDLRTPNIVGFEKELEIESFQLLFQMLNVYVVKKLEREF